MEKVIYLTSRQERQKFETQLAKIFEQEINDFKGQVLLSRSSEEKHPLMNIYFVRALSDNKWHQLKRLYDSIK